MLVDSGVGLHHIEITSGGGTDPFSALGLHPFLATAQDVRAAFRRLAIELHPDKQTATSCCREGDLAGLVETRDRALRMIDARPPPWQWAVWVLCTVLSKTSAETIELPLDVELADLHRANVKKVCFGVHRARPGVAPFSRIRQTVYVKLLCQNRDHLLDRVVFPGVGDDPPHDVLLGRHPIGGSRRGDVVVRIRLVAHPVYWTDPVLSPCDLHAKAAVSLLGFYTGERVRLPHPAEERESLDIDFPAAGLGEIDADVLREGRVHVFQGMGLPFACGDGDVDRGDLYVFLRVALPRLDSLSEIDQLRAWGPSCRI